MPVSPLIADLVVANHILYDQGVVDGFGHVSVRSEQRKDRYLLARNMAPSLVQADDILEYDLESSPINAAGRSIRPRSRASIMSWRAEDPFR